METFKYDIYGRLTGAKAWDGDSKETVSDGNSSGFIEFGEYAAVSLIDNEILFQGRNIDPESGLYHFRNRQYDPQHGRFLSRDPAGYADSMCLYQFVNNNPVCYTDPLGRLTLKIWGVEVTVDGNGISGEVELPDGSKLRGGVGLGGTEAEIESGGIRAGARLGPTGIEAHVESGAGSRGGRSGRSGAGAGTDCGEPYCGPDMTDFLRDLIKSADKWISSSLLRRTPGYGLAWLRTNGMGLDWWAGQYHNDKCPSEGCSSTYWLCGECVHDHFIGNFMYGYLGRKFNIPDMVMDAGGTYVQWHTNHKLDAPWDVAGYRVARHYHILALLGADICTTLKSSPFWGVANKTSVPDPLGLYPKPHQTGQNKCKECPDCLPPVLASALPGGSYFGSSWPEP